MLVNKLGFIPGEKYNPSLHSRYLPLTYVAKPTAVIIAQFLFRLQ